MTLEPKAEKYLPTKEPIRPVPTSPIVDSETFLIEFACEAAAHFPDRNSLSSCGNLRQSARPKENAWVATSSVQ